MPESEKDEYFSIINGNYVKQIFFYGPITKSSIFNFITNLTGIIQEMSTDNFIGFSSENNKDLEKYKIVLHISSTGGPVDLAFLATDYIESSPVEIIGIADGLLASSGIIMFLACKQRRMLKHSQLLVHETLHSFDRASFTELNDIIKDANKINKNIKDFYLENTNLTQTQLNKLFKDETLLNYEDALKYGFINIK